MVRSKRNSILLIGGVICILSINFAMLERMMMATSSSEIITDEPLQHYDDASNTLVANNVSAHNKSLSVLENIDTTIWRPNMNIEKRNEDEVISSSASQEALWTDTCQRLLAHENGYWKHSIYNKSDHNATITFLNDIMRQNMYFPHEISWLTGQTSPMGVLGANCKISNKLSMYNTKIGHQCGCSVQAFKPTHSTWVYNQSNASTVTDNNHTSNDYFDKSPTLRLAKKLATANTTLCFVGDSIDYQIYKAMHYTLRRIDQLYQQQYKSKLISVVDREIPVTYSTKAGNESDWFIRGHRPPDDINNDFMHGSRPPQGGFETRSAHSIEETKIRFIGEQQSNNGFSSLARVRFFMAYGWSPWLTDAMETCNVVIMNFALHYKPYGDHINKVTGHTLMNDLKAGITFLTNFTASKTNRIAIWRSALPQHFDTHDGHFSLRLNKLHDQHTCKPLPKTNGTHKQQVYNSVYAEAFAIMCNQQPTTTFGQRSCDHQFRHVCIVKPTADVEYQTPYNFYRANNCTDRLVTNKEAERYEVTGTIYHWSIFDLFDVEWWHVKDKDCSHVCFIPTLFESAFERLEILVTPLLESF